MGRNIQGDTDPFVVWLQDNAGVIVNDKGEMKGSAIQAGFPR
jgi:ribosomal protein L14